MQSHLDTPVVLLHGWGGTFESTWAAAGWVCALAQVHRSAIVIDLPGHGLRAQSREPADYDDLATQLHPQLPTGSQIDAVGFSLGAKLVLELVCRQPRRFRRLVLGGLGGNAFAPEPLGDQLADILEHGSDTHTPAPITALANYGIRPGNDPLALAAVLRRHPNPVLTPERLTTISQPVLLVAGKNDTVAHPIAPLATNLPHARIWTLPDAGHLDLPADPRFQHAALTFLTSS